VYDSIRRFSLPLPVCQHPLEVDGRRYRLDLCYPQERVVVEVDGFEHHNGRTTFDRDRTRGNDIALAGYLVLHVTAAFTDWHIATTVAAALRLPPPSRPERQLTFAAWQSVWSSVALTAPLRTKHSADGATGAGGETGQALGLVPDLAADSIALRRCRIGSGSWPTSSKRRAISSGVQRPSLRISRTSAGWFHTAIRLAFTV
jgi:uncharacterized protein DUF559